MSADQEETASQIVGQDVPLDAGLDVPETPDVSQVREKAEDAAEPEASSSDPMIAALLREREGYVAHGKDDRIKAVDAELDRRGHGAAKKAAPKQRATRESRQTTADAPAKKTAAKKRTQKKS